MPHFTVASLRGRELGQWAAMVRSRLGDVSDRMQPNDMPQVTGQVGLLSPMQHGQRRHLGTEAF